MFPTVMYHPVLAPTGQTFTDEAALNALDEDWVDTPTKFPSTPAADAPPPADVPTAEPFGPPTPSGPNPRHGRTTREVAP